MKKIKYFSIFLLSISIFLFNTNQETYALEVENNIESIILSGPIEIGESIPSDEIFDFNNLFEMSGESEPLKSTKDRTPPPVYSIVSTQRNADSYDSWSTVVSGYGPATLSYSKSRGWQNTYSGSLLVSKNSVNSSLGFDITKSGSTTASYSVKIPSNKRYGIQVRNVYRNYTVKQKKYFMQQTTYHNLYSKKFDHFEYRWVQL